MDENDKDKTNQNEKQKRDYNFIYFIDTHEKTKKFKIYLSEEYEGADSLEVIKQKEIKKPPIELSTIIYRFKIFPGSITRGEGQKYELLVYAEDEENKKHQYKIQFTDETKDYI